MTRLRKEHKESTDSVKCKHDTLISKKNYEMSALKLEHQKEMGEKKLQHAELVLKSNAQEAQISTMKNTIKELKTLTSEYDKVKIYE